MINSLQIHSNILHLQWIAKIEVTPTSIIFGCMLYLCITYVLANCKLAILPFSGLDIVTFNQ